MKKRRKWLAALMTFAMLVTMLPAGAFAQEGTETEKPSLNISNSKTATNLVQNEAGDWQSQVTLSLPAADYQKEIDVVFVIDDTSAGSKIWASAAEQFLDELRAKQNLSINLGLVTFDAVSRDWLEVTTGGDLKGCVSISDEDNYTAIVEALNTELTYDGVGEAKKLGGSNTEWAIDYATDMLNESGSDDQYMIVFSDMFGYVYRGDLTVDGTTYQDVPMSKLHETYEIGQLAIAMPKYDSWDELNTEEGRASDNKDYDEFFRISSAWDDFWEIYRDDQAPMTADEALEDAAHTIYAEDYLTPFEKSTYLTYDNIVEAVADNHIKVTIANNSFNPNGNESDATGAKIEEIKNQMLDDLEKDGYINLIREDVEPNSGFDDTQLPEIFEQLEDELIQVVGADSYVIDEMGKVFDFVQEKDPVLTVDGEALTVAQIADPEKLNGATCGWTYGDGSDPDRFELYYYENGGTFGEKAVKADSLVWKTNEDITKENIVSLQYTIQLTAPSEEPGTFGEYDKDGDGILDNDNGESLGTEVEGKGLATNNVATIYPIDSEGNVGVSVDFPVPTVSYTVEDPGSVIIEPANITIYTGGDGYESVVDGVGTEIGDSDQGLPTPGYLITLPEEIDNEFFDGQKEAADLSDRVQFVYDGNNDGDYNDAGVDRVWKLEMYSQGEGATSQTSDEIARYVYRMDADALSGEPIRLQFTQGDKFMTTDDFEISLADLYQKYDMTIYPGELEQGNIKTQILDEEGTVVKTLGVDVATATLTVRGTTDDEVINTVGTDTSDVTENEHHITAVASDADTSYVINTSNVSVDPSSVSLLSDDLVDTEPLQSYIVEKDIANNTANYQYRYLDLVDSNNGNVWVTPSRPIDIYWKLPEGTNSEDYDFQIVHFQGLDREYDDLDGQLADNTPVVLSTDTNGGLTIETVGNEDYLKFSTQTFSPFVLVWDEKEDEPDNPGGGTIIVPDDPDKEDPDTPTLNTEDHYSYIVGYPEDYRTGEATDDESLWPVKPQGNITRAEVATIFYRLLTNDARSENWTTSNDYTDVSADSWYNTPVSTLSAMGIVRGYEDGSFRPNASITRAEFAAIAVRFFESDAVNYEEGLFTDIAGSEWFADAVQAAKDHDIIGGYPDGTFKPNNPITRAEACSIVNRTTKRVPDADHLLAEDQMRNWPDNANTEAWYYADMQEATNGHYYDYVLDDNEEIVREEWTSAREPIDWDAVEAELEASH